jgi:hypothetical protein
MTTYRRLPDGLRTNISEANRPPDVVVSRLATTMEGKPMDIADFSDELAALVQEALESGVSVADVAATLTAKVSEIETASASEDDAGEGEEEEDEPA